MARQSHHAQLPAKVLWVYCKQEMLGEVWDRVLLQVVVTILNSSICIAIVSQSR